MNIHAMSSQNPTSSDPACRRPQAHADDGAASDEPPEAVREGLHEWHAQRTEAEMRNGKLRQIRAELDAERAHQEILTQFMRHSPIYAFIKTVTPAESRVLQASDNYQQMLGLPVSEMTGKTMAELFPPALAAKITADDWAVVARGERLELEEEFNGRIYASLKFPITQGGQTLLAGYTTDVTERKQAEVAVQTSEKRYRESINLAVDGILLGDHTGMIIDANQNICGLFGLALDNIIGKHIRDLPFTRDSLERNPFRTDLLQAGQVVISERTIIHTDGSEIEIEMRTKMMPDGTYQSIYRDVTERKRMEKQLAAEREHYFNFYHLSPVGYFSLDEEGLILEVNRTSATLLGVGRGALIKQPASRFIFSADLNLYDRCCQQLVETTLPQACEVRMVNLSGTLFWAHLDMTLAPAAGGVSVRRIVLSDITERIQAQTALQASKVRLRQLVAELSRVEEREQQRLALCLHDEVAQTLALLRMKLDVVAATLDAGPVQAELMQAGDLLEHALGQTRSLVFNLGSPVLYQLGMVAAMAWTGEKLCQDHHLIFVRRDHGEPGQLDMEQKVLLFRCTRELMTNTVKHARATRLTMAVEEISGHVCVTIEDDGRGFNISCLDPQAQTGFGLFSVQERLAAAGGECAVKSAPGGGGTRVTLTLPCISSSAT